MATNDLIVSVSGIRGIVGESLTPEIAAAFGAAFGTHLEGHAVVVSRDGRPSGQMLQAAVEAALMSTGCAVHSSGVLSTPACGFAVRQLHAAGGVQITASHNPAPYNGLKLFNSRGMVLTPQEGEKVLAIYRSGQFRQVRGIPSRRERAGLESVHVAKALECVDRDLIRARRFRVLIDSNHGAGGPEAAVLLEGLGLNPDQQVFVGGHGVPDGQFSHEPEPTEENLRTIAPLVPENRCDIGFALDPDADRLAIFDETGRYIGEELTLALATEFRLRQQRGPVVANMSTSRIIEDITTKRGCPFHRAPVGEVNVVLKMLELGAVIGGEGNGGVIDPRVGLVRDPFIGMGLILNLLAETGKKLSELVADLPRYHIVKTKAPVERAALPALYSLLKSRWPDAKVNQDDGLRLDWPDRWVHIRPSNTEPIVRVIAEAPSREEAATLADEVVGESKPR